MNTYATTSLENTQTHAGTLGQILDSFIGIIKPRRANLPKKSNFSELKHSFEITKGIRKSLLVIHVESDADHQDDVNARLADQERVLQQLRSVFGIRATAAAIGDKEYAVLLHGIDQCNELIPRIEEMLSRTSAGHSNEHQVSLTCRVGVARCPIDADELSDSIRMASNAATELVNSEHTYQFISRRHR